MDMKGSLLMQVCGLNWHNKGIVLQEEIVGCGEIYATFQTLPLGPAILFEKCSLQFSLAFPIFFSKRSIKLDGWRNLVNMI